MCFISDPLLLVLHVSIPLAKKLKDCGVFGKSSDELLNYALKNRAEWELKGQQVVSEMVEALNRSLDEEHVTYGGEETKAESAV